MDGLLFVNGEKMVWSSHDMVWKFDWVREELGSMVFEVSGVMDQRYGLTAMSDVVGSVSIEWRQRGMPGFSLVSVFMGLLFPFLFTDDRYYFRVRLFK